MKYTENFFSFAKRRRFEVSIFILALFLRALFLFFSLELHGFSVDHLKADGYYEISENLIHHGIFSRSNATLEPDSIRTPGLPFLLYPFLAVRYGMPVFLMLQSIVASLLPLLGRKLALDAGLSPRSAGAVAIIMALDPFSISISSRILSETFFTFFFLLFMITSLRLVQALRGESVKPRLQKTALIAGFLLGLATLFRPTTLYLPLVLVVGLLLVRSLRLRYYWRHAFVFLAVSFVVILPWVARNYRVFGVAGYSSLKDEVIYAQLAPSILSLKYNEAYAAAQQRFFGKRNPDPSFFPDIMLDEAREYRREALAVVTANPLQFMQIAAISMVSFFTHDGSLDLLGMIRQAGAVHSFPKSLALVGYAPSEILTLVGNILQTPLALVLMMRFFWMLAAMLFLVSALYLIAGKRMNLATGFILLCVVYFAVTTIMNGLAVNARFRFPVNSLFLVIALQAPFLKPRAKSDARRATLTP